MKSIFNCRMLIAVVVVAVFALGFGTVAASAAEKNYRYSNKYISDAVVYNGVEAVEIDSNSLDLDKQEIDVYCNRRM